MEIGIVQHNNGVFHILMYYAYSCRSQSYVFMLTHEIWLIALIHMHDPEAAVVLREGVGDGVCRGVVQTGVGWVLRNDLY